MSDIDNLLDATLDDLEDLPEFKPFPVGVHKILGTLALKKVNGAQAVEFDMKAIETEELANDGDTPLASGDSTSILFKFDNEYGRGNFKRIAGMLAEGLGITGSTNREIIEAVNEVECIVVTSLRVDKNDKEKFYTNVKELAVV